MQPDILLPSVVFPLLNVSYFAHKSLDFVAFVLLLNHICIADRFSLCAERC